MGTERVDFKSGDWWEFRDYLCHGAAKAVKKLSMAALNLDKEKPAVDFARVNVHDMNDAMALHSTVAWSYGPVNEQVFDTIPEDDYGVVLAKMNRLYGELPPLARNGGRSSGSRFSPRSLLSRLSPLTS